MEYDPKRADSDYNRELLRRLNLGLPMTKSDRRAAKKLADAR